MYWSTLESDSASALRIVQIFGRTADRIFISGTDKTICRHAEKNDAIFTLNSAVFRKFSSTSSTINHSSGRPDIHRWTIFSESDTPGALICGMVEILRRSNTLERNERGRSPCCRDSSTRLIASSDHATPIWRPISAASMRNICRFHPIVHFAGSVPVTSGDRVAPVVFTTTFISDRSACSAVRRIADFPSPRYARSTRSACSGFKNSDTSERETK